MGSVSQDALFWINLIFFTSFDCSLDNCDQNEPAGGPLGHPAAVLIEHQAGGQRGEEEGGGGEDGGRLQLGLAGVLPQRPDYDQLQGRRH